MKKTLTEKIGIIALFNLGFLSIYYLNISFIFNSFDIISNTNTGDRFIIAFFAMVIVMANSFLMYDTLED